MRHSRRRSTSCLPIPARELTTTFSDTEIMTSLGSPAQSPLWSKSLEHLRDFKAPLFVPTGRCVPN
ncbi:hypothetical protein Plhal304r1_c064g0152261 [Plasmopara halstedii]